MSHSAVEYLRHILDETHYLIQASFHLEKEIFVADETLKRAFVRSLEIIGEATKQVDEATRQWGTGDSDMLEYYPLCDAVHVVRNLAQLSSAIDKLFIDG